jgi:MoaA/NifB/PqqE/SkfB family radical SAM enzyme
VDSKQLAVRPRARLETLCYRITQHCNLSCHHCRAGSSPATRHYSDVQSVLRFVELAQNVLGLRHVSISGGEPALDRRLSSLVEQLISMRLFVTVTTNGTIPVSRALARAAAEHVNQLHVRVSIDGTDSIHDGIRGVGTHARAMRELGEIRRGLGWVGLNTVALPELLPVAPALARIAIDCDVDEWAFITPVPQGSALGRPWYAETHVPVAHELAAAARKAGFDRRLIVWDFLSTPETSILIESTGEIVLSGTGAQHRAITTLNEMDVERIAEAIEIAMCHSAHCHFLWKGWR